MPDHTVYPEHAPIGRYADNDTLDEHCALCHRPIRVGQLYVNDRVPPMHLDCAQ
jgi:hypothetical protein